MQKILIADDEVAIRKLMGSFLRKEGFEVFEAKDGQEAIEIFFNEDDIALCIFDVMMPRMTGPEACQIIRESSDVPIIMLTAKTEEDDQIKGFKSGADDYVGKPFSLTVLLYRIKSILKRYDSNDDIISLNGIEINRESHEVKVNGKKIVLTQKEYELLIYLFSNKNILLTREKIIQTIWNYDYNGEERTVDTHIKNLRAKLGQAGDIIKTIRGYGYKVEEYE